MYRRKLMALFDVQFELVSIYKYNKCSVGYRLLSVQGGRMMSFLPMKSQTEGIVPAEAGFMEFNLISDLGYQEWRGMFTELGVKATLFNGYMLQPSNRDVLISCTPVQLHLFQDGVYVTPPFEAHEYYFRLPRQQLQIGKAYFRIPPELTASNLDGHKPARSELYALDMWVTNGDSAVSGPSQTVPAQEPTLNFSSQTGDQTIYTMIYEAHIRTDKRSYEIERFSSEQLFDKDNRR
jgi:hypothetical protein